MHYFIVNSLLVVNLSQPLEIAPIFPNSHTRFPSVSTVLLSQDNSAGFEIDDFDFWVEQCVALSDEAEFEGALTACEKAISLEPRQDNTELWAARGNALFYLGRYTESLASFNRVVQASPKNSWAIAYQCANFVQLTQYADAVDTCEQALRIDGSWGNSSPAFAWYYRGLALRQMGRLETAFDSFEQALVIDPDDARASAGRCETLSALGQTELFTPDCGIREAVAFYTQALTQYPNEVAILMQQGLALEQLGSQIGSYEQALTSYNRVIELNPESSIALARRCGVLNQLEQYEAALESCEQAFQHDGRWGANGLAYAWNQHSAALLGLGRYEESVASANRAIAIEPTYAPAWNDKAVSLWHLEQPAQAKIAVEQAIALYEEQLADLQQNTFERSNPDPPIVFYRGQALAWFNQGRILTRLAAVQRRGAAAEELYKTAALSYIKALEICTQATAEPIISIALVNDTTLAAIWANLGAAYLYFDAAQAAEASLKAIELDQNSFQGWYNRGLALSRLQQFKLALQAYDQAEHLSPNNVDVLTARGLTLERKGDLQGAIAAFDQILNLYPDYAIAQRHLNRLVNVANQQL